MTTAADGAAALDIGRRRVRPTSSCSTSGCPTSTAWTSSGRIRGYSRTPIVVLSGRSGSGDKVDALEAGADDYVTKPFDVNELVARLRAVTRRASPTTCTRDQDRSGGGQPRGEDRASGSARTAPPSAWPRRRPSGGCWKCCVTHPGRLISQTALLEELRGQADYTDSSYLRIYIAQLRRKLEPEPSRPRHLLTEPGMGYRFQP